MEGKPLVPKLRFPKFRDAPGWAEETFSHLYRFAPTNTFSRDQLNYTSGSVKNIHYGDIHTRFQALFDIRREIVPFINPAYLLGEPSPVSLCSEGDMVFADASEDVADVGKSIEIIELDGQQVVSGTHTILAKRSGSHLRIGFGGHLFRSSRIRTRIQKESQGAKVLGISPRRLSIVPVSFPTDHAEQQKIAECLTSLDELIAAERRKLDSLRAHKKGLMQNLFPREGEMIPRHRFHEYINQDEWTEETFGEQVRFQSGGTPPKGNADYWNGSIPWVSAKDMKKLILDDTEDHITALAAEQGAKQVQTGTVLLLTRGMTLLKDLPICIAGRPMSFNQDVKALRPIGDLHGLFLAYLLQNQKHQILRSVDIAGHGTGRLDTEKLKAITFLLPGRKEQCRIADCLTSLDTLVTAQAKKLDTLKRHKQGLMQGLFPSSEAAEA